MTTTSDALLRALGWALTHSLWQASLIAILLLVLLPRLGTARRRYRAAYAGLMLVFGAAVVTFCWKYQPPAAEAPAADGMAALPEAQFSSFLQLNSQLLANDIPARFSEWLEAHHVLVVGLWLLGFLFFLLRLGAGMGHLYRLRTRGLVSSEAAWQDRMERIGHWMGLKGTVQLMESALVHAPLTIGWIKPLVLLPVGLVNQLSAAEVEAILAHELAHIARRDWLFNLIQAFVETIFYYHPAVWWLSGVIHRERENACDDLALAATGNPIAFARALVHVQELAAPAPVLALAMGGKRRKPLLERVRRILNQAPQQQHQVMEKITATVILLALLILVGMRANTVPGGIEAAFAQIVDLPESIFDAPEQIQNDSLPKPKRTQTITREDENGKVQAEFKNGELTRLNIDGKEIPESEFEDHEDLVEELTEEITPPPLPPLPGLPSMPEMHGFPPMAPIAPLAPLAPRGSNLSIVTDKDGDGNTVIMLQNGEKITEMTVKNGEVWVDGKKVEDGSALNIPGFYLAPNGDGVFFNHSNGAGFSYGNGNAWAYEMDAADQERLQAEVERAMAETERTMAENRVEMEKEMARAHEAWQESQKNWEKEQKAWEKEQKKWEKEQKQWEKEQRAWEAKSKAAQDMIRKELIKDGLITKGTTFRVAISPKYLKVNGKKQSEELRVKYARMLQEAMGATFEGDSWMYTFNWDGEEN